MAQRVHLIPVEPRTAGLLGSAILERRPAVSVAISSGSPPPSTRPSPGQPGTVSGCWKGMSWYNLIRGIIAHGQYAPYRRWLRPLGKEER
jgi:hypothetical protein